ncbi:hypothetical protein D3C86_1584390 [compost metagenome]
MLAHIQHPHILLELPRLGLVADQYQSFADLRQAHLNPLEEADRPLAFQLGVIQEAAPLGASGQITLQNVAGMVAGVVVILGGHQRHAHVGVARRQQHGGIGAEIGIGVVGLHRQEHLAHIDHPIGAVQVGYVGEHGVMLAADDLLAGDAPAAVRGVGQPLAGHQPNVSR